MGESCADQQEYIRQVLDAYRKTPGPWEPFAGPDRLLAAELHQRGVPLTAIGNALALAAARRLVRPAGAAPLSSYRIGGATAPLRSRLIHRAEPGGLW